MKSFRLDCLRPVTTPVREIADYSVEERSRFRDAFSSVASDYRRRRRIGYIVAVGFVMCILLSIVFSKMLPWLAIPALTFWIIGLVTVMRGESLVCPGCSNSIEYSFGRYCPECGSSQLQPGGWFRSRHCAACGKSIRRYKRRNYKIRACTHCGLVLDNTGL
jgi:hypothetical protein